MDNRQTPAAGDAIESLRREIAQLEHELRHVNDDLERNRTRSLEWRAQQLRDSIALCECDLAKLAGALQSDGNPA
jgi:chromosome segregation ATPase